MRQGNVEVVSPPEVNLDSVRDDLASVVQQALEPAHVSVWLSERW